MFSGDDIFDTLPKLDMIEIIKESCHINEINFYFQMTYNRYDKIGVCSNTITPGIYLYTLRLYKNNIGVCLPNNVMRYATTNYNTIAKLVAKLHNMFKINQN